MTTILLPFGAFLVVAGAIGTVGLLLRDRSMRGESRLDAFMGHRPDGDPNASSVEIWKEAAFEDDKKNFFDQIIPTLPSLQKLFQQAEVNIKPNVLIGISVLLGILGATASWMMHVPWFLLPLPALCLFCVPWAWLLHKRKSRLKKFASQLPDAMELLARALRAGQSLVAGFHVVSEEMPEPISTEFRRVYEEQNLGINLDDSLKALCDRVPNLDLRFFATSVAIQRQTGGDLAEILDKIGYVIRERFRIQGQVKALTAEGRLSGVILLAMPFLMFFIVLHLNPGYVELLWTTNEGIRMTVFALFMQVLGAITIRKIVNIKV